MFPVENPVCVDKVASGESQFPGWEPFLPHLVHPVKVAVVEALVYICKPLSAAEFSRLLSGGGKSFGESNVRYHLHHLVKIGVLEVVPSACSGEGSRAEKYFHFAGADGV
jgi:hypothetical protein